jgi:hypothetical protein
MQGGADRLPAAGPVEPLAHPANQTAQRPARRRIGAGYGPECGGALGGTDCFAEAGFDLRAKGGGRRCADRSAPRGRGCCRDAATPAPSAGDGASARQRAWRNSPE